jgi:hypothetical protein
MTSRSSRSATGRNRGCSGGRHELTLTRCFPDSGLRLTSGSARSAGSDLGLDCVRLDTRVDHVLVAFVVGQSRSCLFDCQPKLPRQLRHVAVHSWQVTNQRPHRHSTAGNPDVGRSRLMWIILNVSRDQLIIAMTARRPSARSLFHRAIWKSPWLQCLRRRS